MSDDQPTKRFDAQNGDAPTVRFEPAGAAPPPGGGEPPVGPPLDPPSSPEPKSRKLLIILSIIGGVLLIAVVIMLTLLFSRGSGGDITPVPSESPSATPSETPTPSTSATEEAEPTAEPTTAPPPATASPSFATFSAPTSANCTAANPTSQLTFAWSSADATMAWFGVRTTNAKEEPYEEVPTTATYTFDYQCSNETEIYTVTLEDAGGNLTHKTVTVTKN
ncbi:hypothetical protein [Salinibacterium sp. SWN248]|uniref:hypothetical protein n=1 Tax=Salinibacterium sp. SWN248 TaxID=2792056 RepID=UPI0018CED8E7|nr:hypothetical protein [Salinibacterium sp. SWN248]MBH0023867.1 hypothetical protein [Salinibacterium sp. SWN248]